MKSKLSQNHPFASAPVSSRSHPTCLAAALLITFATSSAQAQSWAGALAGATNDAAHQWNVDANWTGAFPNAVGAAAVLTGDFTAATSVFLQQGITLGSLTLGDTAATNVAVTVATGTGTNTLTLDNTASTAATLTSIGTGNTISALLQLNDNLEVATNTSLTLSGIISETGGAKSITKTSLGGSTFTPLTLSGNNTFTGGVTNQQGVIYVGNDNALGTGTFTFANAVGGLGNGLTLNSPANRTIANPIVLANAAVVTGTQYATIGSDGGTTGFRTLTFTGPFSSAGAAASQRFLVDAIGNETGLNEGSVIVSGDWSAFDRGIGMNGGSFVINSAASISATGFYRLEGTSVGSSSKIILNGAYTMPNELRFSAATGIRNSFGARNAAGTTALLSGNVVHSGAAGANLFSQNAGATLAISGIISGAGGTIRINDSYTYTSTNTVNTLETPTGTVALTNTAPNTLSNGFTVVRGTLLFNGIDSASGTGGGQLTVGTTGAAVPPQAGAAAINSRIITGVNNGIAKSLQIGQSIAATNITPGSIITGISIGAGDDSASASTVVINNAFTVATPDVQFTTTAFSTSGTIGGTGRIAPVVPNGVTVNNGSSVSLVDGAAGDLLIRFVSSGDPLSLPGVASFATGSTFNFELAAPGTGDRIDFTGLTTGGVGAGGGGSVAFNSNVVNFTGLPGIGAGEYTLFTFNAAGKYTGTLTAGTLPVGIASAVFDYSDPLAIKVTLTAGTSPYTTWANGFLPADVSNPAGDNDNDGLVNQQEFAFGLNPLSGSSVNPILVQLSKDSGTFTYQRRAGTGLTYTVFKSTTLAAGSWTPAGGSESVGGVDGNGNVSMLVTLPGAPLGDTKLFVRVAAE